MSKIIFKLYSDGGSFNNGRKNKELPQYGACGYALTLNEKILHSKSVPLGDVTISVSELEGSILAIEEMYKRCENLKKTKLPKPYNFIVCTDSQYVVKGFNERMSKWIKDGWCVKSGDPVANLDYWKKLYSFSQNKDLNIKFKHVKGHTKSEDYDSRMNHFVDRLAVAEVKKWKDKHGYK